MLRTAAALRLQEEHHDEQQGSPASGAPPPGRSGRGKEAAADTRSPPIPSGVMLKWRPVQQQKEHQEEAEEASATTTGKQQQVWLPLCVFPSPVAADPFSPGKPASDPPSSLHPFFPLSHGCTVSSSSSFSSFPSPFP